MKRYISRVTLLALLAFAISCDSNTSTQVETPKVAELKTINNGPIELAATNFTGSSDESLNSEGNSVTTKGEGWLSYDINVLEPGRYQIDITAKSIGKEGSIWIEDHVDNTDGRNYDVTGKYSFKQSEELSISSKYGSPLNSGNHKIKLNYDGNLEISNISFILMRPQQNTPQSLTQSMDGSEWEVVWSDEFDGASVDTDKWLFDIGDWGWGNNELQYYTDNDITNARVEDGKLILEATKNEDGTTWNSARLTTRGKTSFLYGKIEFSAIVPEGRGTWAAGWTLGDSYVDEKSWPYCGEIDILETVGYEMKDGNGIAHATVHTPAYYFKINNQISSVTDVPNVTSEFHTYAVEWTPTEVRGYVDGNHYYTYDKNANELEWPFAKPQNIILNLAMGGGWGGAMGMDESLTSQKFIIDYVRVSQLK